VPAAAVIPALIAYIKVAAVKKLVVGFWMGKVFVVPGEQFKRIVLLPFEDSVSS